MRKPFLSFKCFIVAMLLSLHGTSFAAETLKVAVSPWYFPVIFLDHDEIVGIDPDVAKAVGEKLGLEVEFITMPRDLIGKAVADGEVDFGLGAIEAASYLRTDAASHVDPEKIKLLNYYEMPAAFVSRNADITKIEALKNQIVGTYAYTKGRDQINQWQTEGLVKRVFGFESESVLVNTLKLKRVDAILVGLPSALELSATSEGVWHTLQFDAANMIREPIAVVLPTSSADQAKLEKITQAFQQLNESGALKEIAGRWIDTP